MFVSLSCRFRPSGEAPAPHKFSFFKYGLNHDKFLIRIACAGRSRQRNCLFVHEILNLPFQKSCRKLSTSPAKAVLLLICFLSQLLCESNKDETNCAAFTVGLAEMLMLLLGKCVFVRQQ